MGTMKQNSAWDDDDEKMLGFIRYHEGEIKMVALVIGHSSSFGNMEQCNDLPEGPPNNGFPMRNSHLY